MTEDREEGFLGRWSRRKREAGHGSEPEASAEAAPAPAGRVPAAEAEARERELAANRAAAEAVDLETIGRDTDLSVFFREGVPGELKQAALRRVWRSDPVFAVLDGLNDYDENFNDPSRILGSFKSAWKVGRGYLSDEDAAPAAVDEAEEKAQATPEPDDPGPSAGAEPEAPPQPAAQAAPPAPHQPDEAEEEPPRPTVSLRARRARFGDG